MKLSAMQARSLAAGALRGLGLEDEAATVAADHLLDAHARRDGSTGLASILALEHRLAVAGHHSRPIATLRETPAMALVDGGGNVGYVVAHHGTRLAIDKAAKQGVGCVGATNTQDLGRLGYYAELAERGGFSAACAAIVQGDVRGDDGGAAPAVLARLLAALARDPHAVFRAEQGMAFVIVVIDPRCLVPAFDLQPQRSEPLSAMGLPLPDKDIELPEQLHRTLLKLGDARPATAA
jgi:hypothetical protein